MLREKKQAEKEFRRALRIELAKFRNEEREKILETRTKDTKMFHKQVRKNRRQGNDMIMELEVNGKNYIESEIIKNFFSFLISEFS
jgi:guanylate kinase